MNKPAARKSGTKTAVICVLVAALICTVLSGYSFLRVLSRDESFPSDSALKNASDPVTFDTENCGYLYLITGNSLTLAEGCVSSDESIATCADGVVTANSSGQALISVLDSGGKFRVWNLNVSDYEDIILPIVKTHQISATGESTGWNCSDSSVATVDENGLIIPHKVGTCVITGQDTDGRQYAFNVSVKKTAYITIDDWPESCTLSMLDVLDKYNIKATFFLCAQNKNLDIYRKIVDSGHAIGNHTYNHRIKYLYESFRNMCGSVYEMDEWMLKNLDVETKLLRYPGGYYGNNSAQRQSYAKLVKKGYRIFDWTCALGDTKYTQPDDLMNNLRRLLNEDVEIILMHNKKYTAAVFEDVVRYILDNDYVCLPLDEQSPTFDFVHEWQYN